jgi:hypothetical protein
MEDIAITGHNLLKIQAESTHIKTEHSAWEGKWGEGGGKDNNK